MEESIKKYWNADSPSYDSFVVKGFSIKRERESWQKLFSEVLGERGSHLLDTGCGPGIVSMQLADLGYKMTSIDFSEKMIEAAKKNALAYGLAIDIMIADAECLPFEDDSFDGIVSDYMLWTVPHPEKVMSEWYRVLKPGQKVVYVDGDWFNDPKRTPFRVSLANFACFLDSPKKYKLKSDKKDIKLDYDLWSKTAKRPEDDIKMMGSAEFTDIKVIHNIQDRVLHGLRHTAYGSTEDHYMVIAKKPN